MINIKKFLQTKNSKSHKIIMPKIDIRSKSMVWAKGMDAEDISLAKGTFGEPDEPAYTKKRVIMPADIFLQRQYAQRPNAKTSTMSYTQWSDVGEYGKERIKGMKESLQDPHKEVPVPIEEYTRTGERRDFQEGRHRGLAAQELGMGVPVILARKRAPPWDRVDKDDPYSDKRATPKSPRGHTDWDNAIEQFPEDKNRRFEGTIKPRYPSRDGFAIKWYPTSDVINRHKEVDGPEYDITNPENRIGNRLPNAINFISEKRYVDEGGFEPTLVNNKGSISDGRHRLLALDKLGYTEIPVEEFTDPRNDNTSKDSINLVNPKKHSFGSIGWQNAMEHNINAKMLYKEDFGPTEKAYISTQQEVHPAKDIDITFKKIGIDNSSRDNIFLAKDPLIGHTRTGDEVRKKTIMFTTPDNPKDIYIGSGLKHFNPEDTQNITALSNVVGHEEMHNLLSKKHGENISKQYDNIVTGALTDADTGKLRHNNDEIVGSKTLRVREHKINNTLGPHADIETVAADYYSEGMAVFTPVQEQEINSIDWTKDQKGRELGKGFFGKVFEVKDNPKYALKVALPTGRGKDELTSTDREYEKYKEFKGMDLVAPTIKTSQGLVREKLQVVTRGTGTFDNMDNQKYNNLYAENRNITDDQAEAVVRGINQLTDNNILVGDSVQLGIGIDNKPYMYDQGEMHQSPYNNKWQTRDDNDMHKEIFLNAIDKKEHYDRDHQKEFTEAVNILRNPEMTREEKHAKLEIGTDNNSKDMVIRFGSKPRSMTETQWEEHKDRLNTVTEKGSGADFIAANPKNQFNQITKMNTILGEDKEIKRLNQVHPIHRDEEWHQKYNKESKTALQGQGYNRDEAEKYLELKSKAEQDWSNDMARHPEIKKILEDRNSMPRILKKW